MTISSANIQFPQSPFVGPDGYISLEWQQWLLNPQFLTISFSVAVDVPSGGTGITSGTSGGIPAFTTPTTIASSGVLTQHALVLGGGPGTAPATPVGLGTATTVLHGNAAGDPSYSAVTASDAPTLAPLASPALTGTPTAPTPSANDNSTKLATTSYVDASNPTLNNSLAGDVTLNNTGTFFAGPTVAQGTSGTWLACGTVTCVDTAGGAQFRAKLWDGTTTIASCAFTSSGANIVVSGSVSGFITTPAGNLRIDVEDSTSVNGLIKFNTSGLSKDSMITVVRLG